MKLNIRAKDSFYEYAMNIGYKFSYYVKLSDFFELTVRNLMQWLYLLSYVCASLSAIGIGLLYLRRK